MHLLPPFPRTIWGNGGGDRQRVSPGVKYLPREREFL